MENYKKNCASTGMDFRANQFTGQISQKRSGDNNKNAGLTNVIANVDPCTNSVKKKVVKLDAPTGSTGCVLVRPQFFLVFFSTFHFNALNSAIAFFLLPNSNKYTSFAFSKMHRVILVTTTFDIIENR
jgi:hypothetical protein